MSCVVSTSRLSLTTAAQWDLGGRVSYTWGIGTCAATGGSGGGAANARFRIEVYASAQNVFNRMNPRKVQAGIRFGF